MDEQTYETFWRMHRPERWSLTGNVSRSRSCHVSYTSRQKLHPSILCSCFLCSCQLRPLVTSHGSICKRNYTDAGKSTNMICGYSEFHFQCKVSSTMCREDLEEKRQIIVKGEEERKRSFRVAVAAEDIHQSLVVSSQTPPMQVVNVRFPAPFHRYQKDQLAEVARVRIVLFFLLLKRRSHEHGAS